MDSFAHRQPPLLRTLSTVFVMLWVIVAAFPFLWTVWGSFKVEGDFFSRETWLNAIFGVKTQLQTGAPFTLAGYYGAWVTNGLWRSVMNTIIVTLSVTVISLTFGTLGGYALARSGKRYAFLILIAALVFRAMPHITLVSGYLLPFFQLNVWGVLPTAIIVLVAINQPG
jgi:ABC-type glycerol-3-phosphate transport system permease component